MPQLFIIDDTWNPQPWFSTGGTRAKRFLEGPDGEFYYFKQSQFKPPTDRKPGKEFRFEFWSEVIVSEVGRSLGFDTLQYDIAQLGNIMGCISKSMNGGAGQEMNEGIKYLQAFAPGFQPEKNEQRAHYTFQLIENALEQAKLKHHLSHILELIVLDALVGNGDRHQENWAFLITKELITDKFDRILKEPDAHKIPAWIKRLINFIKRHVVNVKHEAEKTKKPLPKSFYTTRIEPTPIYDSGSSLGRELTESGIAQLLADTQKLQAYVLKGKAEIHWERISEKLSHFDLLRQLMNTHHQSALKPIIERVVSLWSTELIDQIVHSVDMLVPFTHSQYRLPSNRKALILQLLSLRFQFLRAIIQ